MNTHTTTLFLFCLVAVVIFVAIATTGINLFASIKIFAICATISVVIAVVVVGGFSLVYGPPKISRRT